MVKTAGKDENRNSGLSKSKHDTLSEVKLPRDFKDCKFCGRKHLPKKENCPAWKQRCRKCGKIGRFEKVCRLTKVYQVSQEVEYLYINSLAKSKSDQQAFVTFKINQKKDIALQIDTGATCNALPFNEYQGITRDFDGQNLQTTNNVLIMDNKSRLFPRGSTVVQLDRGGHGYRVQFLVVEKRNHRKNSRVNSMGLSMVVVPKMNNQVRVCIDLRDSNNALKRCHYSLPMLEEIATRLPKAKVFSLLEAQSGIWQVKLSEVPVS